MAQIRRIANNPGLGNDPTAVKNVVRVDNEEICVPEHISALELRRRLGDKFDECTSFGFVRNPFSKLLSSYFFYRNGRASKKASSTESMGEFRLRQSPKLVVASGLHHVVGSETTCLSDGQFRVGVQALHDTTGNFTFGSNPVQE